MSPRTFTTAAVTAAAAGAVVLTFATSGAPPAATPPLGPAQSIAAEVGIAGTGPAAPFASGQTEYQWPLDAEPEVLRGFDNPPAPWAAGHRGVDLSAGAGATVVAAGEGVVAFAGTVVNRGVVSIDHADGIRTTYEPLIPAVSAGDVVTAGQVIGHLTPAGAHCTPGCLHWGARTGPQTYVDPLSLLGLEPVVVRLYPPI